MGFNKRSTLLAAVIAVSTQIAAQAACDPAAGLTFTRALTNAGKLVPVPGTLRIVASSLARSVDTIPIHPNCRRQDRRLQIGTSSPTSNDCSAAPSLART